MIVRQDRHTCGSGETYGGGVHEIHVYLSTCRQTRYQIKDGLTGADSQRVRCRACNHHYTPVPKPLSYTEDVRTQALNLYVDGLNFRRIARMLGVHYERVINWVNAVADRLPDPAPAPSETQTVELDEL
jgi:transposase